MTSESLLKFKEAVDEEILEYEKMEELYKLKQAILVQGKTDALWDVDAKIVDRMDSIKHAASQRKEAAKYVCHEECTISEAIEKAKASNDRIAENLQSQKTKLNLLTKSISLYEKTNLELLKHGLTIANKTIDMIVNIVSPQSSQYDNSGKNINNNKDTSISSVIEEA